MSKSLKESLQSKTTFIADGAMATSLYERGFYINRSFEELSIAEPQAVRDTIRAFKQSGSQILHTNTFNATRPKLTHYGLQDQLPQILTASCRLAREVAGDECHVLGLIGPLGLLVEPLGPTSLQEAEDLFFEIASVLANENIDGIAIQSIHDFNELECAIKAVRRATNLPILVGVGLHENLKTAYGHTLKELSALAEKYDLDAIGICGEIGPSTMLTAVEALRKVTTRPILALPNAGMPRYVNDQYIYLCNPDYIGKYAKRFVQAGAQIVGGHSGVYESHIRAIANAIRMAGSQILSTSSQSDEQVLPAAIKPIQEKPKDSISLAERSDWGALLASKQRVVSIELVPPTLKDFDKFEEKCKELKEAGIRFVNIPDGARAMARISSLHLAHHVKQKFGLEPIPHLTCRDRNLIGLQSDLLGAHIAGIRNLLLVTGDPPKLGNNPGASAVYDVDAIGLTHIVSRMNRGLDIGGAPTNTQTEFAIGVALNPTAANQELETRRFRYKIEAGCDYAITQPIYNVDAYEQFIDRVGQTSVPVVMGIWPLVSLRNAEFLKYEVPGVDVPDWVIEEMKKAGDSKEEALKRGLEIAIKTVEKAKNLVSGFQVSAPFNRADLAIQVIKATL